MSSSLQTLFQWHGSYKHVSSLREARGVSRTAILGFWRADVGLFRGLVDRVPWEAVLKGEGVQECILQKRSIKGAAAGRPHMLKDELAGEKTSLLNRELWLELGEKKNESL